MEINKYFLVRVGTRTLEIVTPNLPTRHSAVQGGSKLPGMSVVLSGLEILRIIRTGAVDVYFDNEVINKTFEDQGEGISTERSLMVEEWEKLCQDTMTPGGVETEGEDG